MTSTTQENERKLKLPERETFLWLATQFRSTVPFLIAAALGQTALSGVGVWGAFCSRDVIDTAASGNRESFYVACAMMLLSIVCGISVAIFNSAISERLRARSEIALQRRAFGVLLNKDYTGVTSRHTGELLNRLTSDVKVVTDGLSTILPAAVAFTSRLVFAFAALCYFDKRLAVIFFGLGVCVFCCALLFRGKIKRLHKKMQEAEGRKRSFWHETLLNLFVVKAFSREPEMIDRADGLMKDHYRATMTRRNFGLFVSGGLHAIFSFGYFFAMTWQAYRILLGQSTFGSTLAVLQLVRNVQGPFAGFSGLLPRYYNALASAERLRELEALLDEAGAETERLDGGKLYDEFESIVFENVTFSYQRGKRVVEVFKDASFELPKGANIVVSGRSGIGKSTLFKLLTGVCRPDSGKIYLKTKSRNIPVDRRTRALFSLAPQGNMLFSGSILENVEFFRPRDDEKGAKEALTTASAEFVDELQDGSATTIGEKAAGLSEGQAQRLAIARCVYADAPIALLDEATSALDSATERDVLTRLTRQTNKMLIWISHRPAAFQFVDLELRIDDGACSVLRVVNEQQ